MTRERTISSPSKKVFIMTLKSYVCRDQKLDQGTINSKYNHNCRASSDFWEQFAKFLQGTGETSKTTAQFGMKDKMNIN